jgi:hypothetical protein
MPTLTTAEAARRLGITARAVSLLLRRGALQGERHRESRGPVWYVDEAEVERYRAERKPAHRPRKEN